jgi:hypothetical protein
VILIFLNYFVLLVYQSGVMLATFALAIPKAPFGTLSPPKMMIIGNT